MIHPGRSIASPLQNQKGLALLLVLLVITLLVAMVVEFDYKTRIDLRAAGNLRDGLQATYLAKAGIAAAQATLKDDQKRNSTTNLTAIWAMPLPPLPLGEGTVSVQITDEASKFNINNLVTQSIPHKIVPSSVNEAKQLFTLVQVDPNLVDAIVDWVDTDNEPTGSFGAEEDYYQSLPKPYHCKNNTMDLLSELHLIKGITDEVYNKISPYLTVSSSGATNINTAGPIVLQTLFPSLDATQIKNLVDHRPFQSLGVDIIGPLIGGQQAYSLVVSPLINQTPTLLTVKSDIFLVEARGRAHDIEKTVRALIDRSGSVVRIKNWRVE
jgi:general secretion pathway protein K